MGNVQPGLAGQNHVRSPRLACSLVQQGKCRSFVNIGEGGTEIQGPRPQQGKVRALKVEENISDDGGDGGRRLKWHARRGVREGEECSGWQADTGADRGGKAEANADKRVGSSRGPSDDTGHARLGQAPEVKPEQKCTRRRCWGPEPTTRRSVHSRKGWHMGGEVNSPIDTLVSRCDERARLSVWCGGGHQPLQWRGQRPQWRGEAGTMGPGCGKEEAARFEARRECLSQQAVKRRPGSKATRHNGLGPSARDRDETLQARGGMRGRKKSARCQTGEAAGAQAMRKRSVKNMQCRSTEQVSELRRAGIDTPASRAANS
ncbi:hypothetical protein DFH07DRAFT_768327 [Mycena maculata]|uniref:Uncharacterized protein n=1 Tax=Mycena maculata TaxID=230809 RepID=A0AAD7JX86_9AGAR|nr:hypothetical protein DFH07DRAFT_768327 [Mycena maculata]